MENILYRIENGYEILAILWLSLKRGQNIYNYVVLNLVRIAKISTRKKSEIAKKLITTRLYNSSVGLLQLLNAEV